MFIQQPFNLTGGAAAAPAYVPEGAIWLDGSNDWFSKTLGTPTNNKAWTASFWVKRGELGVQEILFGGAAAPNNDYMGFHSDDTFRFRLESGSGSIEGALYTTQVFRDLTAWMNIVCVFDSANSNAGNRMRLYVNGVEVTAFGTDTNPSLNFDSETDSAVAHYIGANSSGTSDYSGYMSEVVFLDGTASTNASEFGEFNDDGIWIPKDPSALTFGDNGFWLDFADSSDLGKDVSGNDPANSFTATSMTAANWTYDRPADSGSDTGNYCTWNATAPENQAALTYTNGNLTVNCVNSSGTMGTICTTETGKWYYEITMDVDNTFGTVGLIGAALNIQTGGLDGNEAAEWCWQDSSGVTRNNSSAGPTLSTFTAGDVLGWAIDFDNDLIWCHKNGTWQNSATLAEVVAGTATNAIWSGTLAAAAGGITPSVGCNGGTSSTFSLNCGQSAFNTAIPTGFTKINTANLPAPSITKPLDQFLPMLYEGNGGGQRVGNFIPFTDSHTVDDSALFIAGDSDYLSRTPSSSGNRRTWTFSAWVKRGQIGTLSGVHLFGADRGSGYGDRITFGNGDTDDRFNVGFNDAGDGRLQTKQYFKNPSTWTNFVVAVDTTQSTSTDRVKIYINGVLLTADELDTATYPAEDYDTYVNYTTAQMVGARGGAVNQFMDGYMAEVVMIDGTQLAASSFGQTDTSTNRWIPKDVSGLTFGTNGFYLNMESAGMLGLDETSDDNSSGSTNSSASEWQGATGNFTFTGSNITNGSSNSGIYTGGTFRGDFFIQGDLTNGDGGTNNLALGIFDYNEIGTVNTGVGNVGMSSMTNSFWIYTTPDTDEIDTYYGSALQSTENWTSGNTVKINRTGSTVTLLVEDSVVHTWSQSSTGLLKAARGQNNTGDNSNTVSWTGISANNSYAMNNMDTTNGSNQMYDTPTKNTCVFNTNYYYSSQAPDSNVGNVTIGAYDGGNSGYGCPDFVIPSSGKYYWEWKITAMSSASYKFAGQGIYNTANNVIDDGDGFSRDDSWSYYVDYGTSGNDSYAKRWINHSSTNMYAGASESSKTDFTPTYQIAVDMDNGFIYFGKDNTWLNSGDPTSGATGTGGLAIDTGVSWSPMYYNDAGSVESTVSNNWGQWRYYDSAALTLDSDAGGYFRYTAPTNYKALNQDNMAANTAGITGFSWIKNRDAADNHILQDRVRGVYEYLIGNDDAAEATDTNSVQRFLQQGVQIGNMDAVNTSAESLVLWQWAANGAGTVDADGMTKTSDSSTTSITISANATAGFSIIKYTGNGAASTIAHGLGKIPSFIIVKNYSSTGPGWYVYHTEIGATKYLRLEGNGAAQTDSNPWNDGSPVFSTTTFTVGGGGSYINDSGDNHIAYCWAEIEGYTKFGKYTGNGDADGPFIYTGFKPSFVLIKNITSAKSWVMKDGVRNPYNPCTRSLYCNLPNVESPDTPDNDNDIDILATGFKVINSGHTGSNTTDDEYVFMAWADNPFGGSGVAQAKAR